MKGIIYVLMALVVIGSASAVTVDCGTNKWYDWDAGDCVANELQPTFDEVTGIITTNYDDIMSNDDKWSQDSSGTSMGNVKKFLFEDFVDFLKDLFVTRNEFESLEDKYYDLASEGDFTQAVLLEMSDKETNVVEHNGYTCTKTNDNKLICLG